MSSWGCWKNPEYNCVVFPFPFYCPVFFSVRALILETWDLTWNVVLALFVPLFQLSKILWSPHECAISLYFKASNKRICTSRYFFSKNSQKKISHFFPTPKKLFPLIVLFFAFTSYRDTCLKRINKNNFTPQEKNTKFFNCDFLEKNAMVHIWLFGTLEYPWIFNFFCSPEPLNVDYPRFLAKKKHKKI